MALICTKACVVDQDKGHSAPVRSKSKVVAAAKVYMMQPRPQLTITALSCDSNPASLQACRANV